MAFLANLALGSLGSLLLGKAQSKITSHFKSVKSNKRKASTKSVKPAKRFKPSKGVTNKTVTNKTAMSDGRPTHRRLTRMKRAKKLKGNQFSFTQSEYVSSTLASTTGAATNGILYFDELAVRDKIIKSTELIDATQAYPGAPSTTVGHIPVWKGFAASNSDPFGQFNYRSFPTIPILKNRADMEIVSLCNVGCWLDMWVCKTKIACSTQLAQVVFGISSGSLPQDSTVQLNQNGSSFMNTMVQVPDTDPAFDYSKSSVFNSYVRTVSKRRFFLKPGEIVKTSVQLDVKPISPSLIQNMIFMKDDSSNNPIVLSPQFSTIVFYRLHGQPGLTSTSEIVTYVPAKIGILTRVTRVMGFPIFRKPRYGIYGYTSSTVGLNTNLSVGEIINQDEDIVIVPDNI